MGWYAVDLDATLAEWGPGTSNEEDVLQIGDPIPVMVARVKHWLATGKEVRIFTARVGPDTVAECLLQLRRLTDQQAAAQSLNPFDEAVHDPQQYWQEYQRRLIGTWIFATFSRVLPITASKDFHMYEQYDDRAVQVIANTGYTLTEHLISEGVKASLEKPTGGN